MEDEIKEAFEISAEARGLALGGGKQISGTWQYNSGFTREAYYGFCAGVKYANDSMKAVNQSNKEASRHYGSGE